MAKNTEKKLKEVTQKLFDLLGIEVKIGVTQKEDSTEVSLEGEDLGILIGQHGENLESLQLFLSLAANKGSEDWKSVTLDIGGWRKQREESLRAMIERSINKLRERGQEIALPTMSAGQRRMAHVIISEYAGLSSQSVGEEPQRYIIIRKED